MDIVGKAKKLEQKIARTLDAAVVELAGGSEPARIEMVHAVLDRADQQIQEAGRGVRLFPFNKVKVAVLAPPQDKARRARFAAVVDGPPTLTERLQARLRSSGCRADDVIVEVVYAARSGAKWDNPAFDVTFERVPRGVVPAAPASVARLKLTVVAGNAERRSQVFTGGRIDIGRRAQVLDSKQRVVRTNHVAFEEGPEGNSSVSRQHAHITYAAGPGEYRVHDDRSVHGTSVVRAGRTIAVPPVSRGVRLETGDEIVVGQARIKVTLL